MDATRPQITVDSEFKSMLMPLSAEERATLEKSIVAHGCLSPVVVWAEQRLLLDGHHRVEICERLELPYDVREVSLPDRIAALNWVDDNQLGRRNLTPDERLFVLGRRYNRDKRQDGGHGDQKSEYQNDTPNTAERLAKQHGVSVPTVKRAGQFAAAVESLRPTVPDIEERVVAGDIPSRQAVVQAARTPERAEEILKPHVAHNSGNNEWYTPQPYIDAAVATMGGIDLDPASTETANTVVKAKRFLTAEQDGIAKPWKGRVWLNPPYAQPLIQQFCEKLISEVDAGRVDQVCVLVNNATDTEWFHLLASRASAICFPRGRVRFWQPDKIAAPLQGQAVIYIGEQIAAFTEAFKAFGFIVYSQAE